jgi:hypothetical protein
VIAARCWAALRPAIRLWQAEVPGTKAWSREGQALPFQADDRLSFGGYRQARLRKRTITCGKFCAPNAVAFDSVFF